jgi:hypothetical protein
LSARELFPLPGTPIIIINLTIIIPLGKVITYNIFILTINSKVKDKTGMPEPQLGKLERAPG